MIMETAKVFENGRSQAVRLPKKYRFLADEVVVQRLGASLVLTPKDKLWDSFLSGINGFTEDFFTKCIVNYQLFVQIHIC